MFLFKSVDVADHTGFTLDLIHHSVTDLHGTEPGSSNLKQEVEFMSNPNLSKHSRVFLKRRNDYTPHISTFTTSFIL